MVDKYFDRKHRINSEYQTFKVTTQSQTGCEITAINFQQILLLI